MQGLEEYLRVAQYRALKRLDDLSDSRCGQRRDGCSYLCLHGCLESDSILTNVPDKGSDKHAPATEVHPPWHFKNELEPAAVEEPLCDSVVLCEPNY